MLGDRDIVMAWMGEAAIRTHGNSYVHGPWSEAIVVGGHGMGASIDAALARVYM